MNHIKDYLTHLFIILFLIILIGSPLFGIKIWPFTSYSLHMQINANLEVTNFHLSGIGKDGQLKRLSGNEIYPFDPGTLSMALHYKFNRGKYGVEPDKDGIMRLKSAVTGFLELYNRRVNRGKIKGPELTVIDVHLNHFKINGDQTPITFNHTSNRILSVLESLNK